ncbi:MAG TPA: septal ring lytic transglycosylase RlpA family protein [Membranihabitans sp.]|nr:septal ring lytic transglycosylase RlpA family protein [Membranihabitans sp.]
MVCLIFKNRIVRFAAFVIVAAVFSANPVVAQKIVSGTASYYHDSLEGNKTANGETFQQSKLTAAHKNLPFDSWVLLTDPNGQDIVVRINDRLPRNSSRMIDLTTEAARQLDMLRAGIKRVGMKVISVQEAWHWYLENGFINIDVAWR